MSDIESIIQQMTLEEKAALCTGAGPWTTTPILRLGVPELVVSDGPHGVRHPQDVSKIGSPSHPATCFPTASSLACTWDVDLLREMGQFKRIGYRRVPSSNHRYPLATVERPIAGGAI